MKTIFVSSTFRDMNYERDAIHHKVAPALNAIAHKYGDHIIFRDLRWGVDTSELDSDAGEKKVLRFCLDEIDSCKPYMIVLLGDRYGWMPENMDLVEDVIADRPNFSLPRNQDNHLERISVTALEIEYGILSNLVPMHHSLFYFRKIEGTTPKKYKKDYSAETGEEYKGKLPNLQNSITTCHEYKPYNLRWEKEELVGLDEFVTMVTEDVRKWMEPEWEKLEELRKETEKLTEEERIRKLDQRIQWEMAHLKEKMFAARDDLVAHYVSLLDEGTNLFAIQGASGTGKTTLMSRLAVVLKEQGYGVLPLFAGLTSQTGTAFDILRYIVDYISSALNLTFDDDNYDTRSVFEKWETRLSEAIAYWNDQAKARLVILVDAVDQLCADEWRDRLSFIPTNLSNKVQLVFSCLDSFELSQKIHVEFVPSLDNTMKGEVVWGILHFLNRQLSKEVVDVIIHKQNANNPLYLSLLVQRLLMMNRIDFEIISAQNGNQMTAISNRQIELLNMCSDDAEGLSADIIDVASSYIGKDFVKTALRYIAVSRHGLREQDLESILLSQGIKWNSLDFVLFTNLLGNFFIQREDGRYDFSHRLIREGCTREIYEEEIRPLHMHILAYLKTLDFDDPVCQQEIVWHTMSAGDELFFVEYVLRLSKLDASLPVVVFAKKDIFDCSIEDAGEWLGTLLEKIEFDKSDASARDSHIGNRLLGWLTNIVHGSKNTYSYDEVKRLANFLDMNVNFNYIMKTKLNSFLRINEAYQKLVTRLTEIDENTDNQILLAKCCRACADIYEQFNVGTDREMAYKMNDMINREISIYANLMTKNNDIEIRKKALIAQAGKLQMDMILHPNEFISGNYTNKVDYKLAINKLIDAAQSIYSDDRTIENYALLLNMFSINAHCIMMKVGEENDFNSVNNEIFSHMEDIMIELENSIDGIITTDEGRRVVKSLVVSYNIMERRYRADNPLTAFEYNRKALDIVTRISKINYSYALAYQEAILLRSRAELYRLMQMTTEARDNHIKALEIDSFLAEKLGRKRLYMSMMMDNIYIGLTFRRDNKCLEEEQKYYEQALQIADKHNIQVLNGYIWNALSAVYDLRASEIKELLKTEYDLTKRLEMEEKMKQFIAQSESAKSRCGFFNNLELADIAANAMREYM